MFGHHWKLKNHLHHSYWNSGINPWKYTRCNDMERKILNIFITLICSQTFKEIGGKTRRSAWLVNKSSSKITFIINFTGKRSFSACSRKILHIYVWFRSLICINSVINIINGIGPYGVINQFFPHKSHKMSIKIIMK